ncbi:radical SAM protein [Anaerocolumna sp. MB42-C2]|uniref:radical SAM protein n=1 Tax=Anaerocolumna sp. MB42-C2 TaxID=3070997 RepID=UPI0027DF43B6|nr:radical SAM protein [Anaerocolumna sp. MB42-C2]WMJ90198.1 radical SAM protein [Anaerocolumna sp. MB42-C2]
MKINIIAPFTLKAVYLAEKLIASGENVRFFDKSVMLQGKEYKGILIEPYEASENAKVYICHKVHQLEIMMECERLGFSEISKYEDLMSKDDEIIASTRIDLESLMAIKPEEFYFSWQREINTNRFLAGLETSKRADAICFDAIDLMITDRCTLKCDGCAALMHYFVRQTDVPFEIIKKGISNAKKYIDYVDYLMIRGGEPFIHPDLPKILYCVREEQFGRRPVLITNGTLIPKSDVVRVMKETDVEVDISDYGDASCKLVELVDLLKSNSIKHRVLKHPHWSRIRAISEKHEDGAKKRAECHFCVQLKGSKFYICSFLAAERELGHIPINVTNSVDFSEMHCNRQLLRDYLSGVVVPQGCSWCNGASQAQYDFDKIPVGKQLRESVTYKKYCELE